jgi:hypothetical protein
MDAFVPAFVKRTMTAEMLGKALASKHDRRSREDQERESDAIAKAVTESGLR